MYIGSQQEVIRTIEVNIEVGTQCFSHDMLSMNTDLMQCHYNRTNTEADRMLPKEKEITMKKPGGNEKVAIEVLGNLARDISC